jgi:hypothetical protein
MDVAAIATAMAAAKVGQTQTAVAAKMMKMNLDAQASIVQVLEAAQENLAAVAPGIGQNLDITV